MRVLPGILLLVIGVAYPMAAVYWLNGRMARKPTPSPRQVGLLLALNGILPISLIFFGLAFLVPRLWALPTIRMIAAMTALASLIIIAALASAAGKSRAEKRGINHGDTEGTEAEIRD